jgi:hypothetical protein
MCASGRASDTYKVDFTLSGWSDSAHEELLPMTMINNAIASAAHAAVTNALAYVAWLHILILHSLKGVDGDTGR